MRNLCDLLNFIAVLVIGYIKTIRASTDIYVCEADNVAYLGYISNICTHVEIYRYSYFLYKFDIDISILITNYSFVSMNIFFVGKYTAGKETLDGAATYSNSNDLSIFRNKGFWYIGNLAPWPPVTAYRCVEQQGCNYMEGMI